MRAGPAAINILPDDVLLLIFHLDRMIYLEDRDPPEPPTIRPLSSWRWRRLIHVCQRWRAVVFASPNLLDVRLVCGPRTRMELISIWPPLPIVIKNPSGLPLPRDFDFDTVFVHHSRVCEISLSCVTRTQLERLVSAIEGRFPALIHLKLGFYEYGHSSPALPDGFLDGSARHLQSFQLHSIPFPAVPKLLLSTTDLVRLTLWDISQHDFVSPETMVTNLAVLANLKALTIGFKSRLSLPGQENRRSPPPTPTVLPALIRFEFKGVVEYLDDFLARFDAPLLNSISVSFFHEPIFDIPQLAQFMRRTTRLKALNEVHVDFGHYSVQVGSLPPTLPFDERFGSGRLHEELSWQLPSLAQVFTSFIPSIRMVEHLYIYGRQQHIPFPFPGIPEDIQWVETLHPFTAVKNVYVSWLFAPRIASALQGLRGEKVRDVLPALENIFLEDLWPSGPVEEAVGKFVAARQLSGHPRAVAFSRWERQGYNFDDFPL